MSMPTTGRDDFLMEMVAKRVHESLKKRYNYTSLLSTRRGYSFTVEVTDSDGEITGHVARITVELEPKHDSRSTP